MPGDAATSTVEFSNLVDRIGAEMRSRMAKPEELNLPPLLERRRQEHTIPNGAFKRHAAFDWIYLWQVAQFDSEDGTYGDSKIILTDVSKASTREEAPRGVIVSAGMRALDNLRSNGIDVGHVVQFVKNAPFRVPVEMVSGHMFHCITCRDGDITASEDLQEAIARGECKIELREFKQPNGEMAEKHVFIGKDGKQWQPQTPWMGDDY